MRWLPREDSEGILDYRETEEEEGVTEAEEAGRCDPCVSEARCMVGVAASPADQRECTPALHCQGVLAPSPLHTQTVGEIKVLCFLHTLRHDRRAQIFNGLRPTELHSTCTMQYICIDSSSILIHHVLVSKRNRIAIVINVRLHVSYMHTKVTLIEIFNVLLADYFERREDDG